VIVAAPGEGDVAGFTPVLEMPGDKFSAVIAVQALDRDGKGVANVLESRYRPLLGFVLRVRNSDQQEATSVRLKVKAYSPEAKLPSGKTVSISQNSGFLSSLCQNILTGIYCLRRVPGFGAPFPLAERRFRSRHSIRSTVERLTFASFACVSAGMMNQAARAFRFVRIRKTSHVPHTPWKKT
jgi:hypothetical protein